MDDITKRIEHKKPSEREIISTEQIDAGAEGLAHSVESDATSAIREANELPHAIAEAIERAGGDTSQLQVELNSLDAEEAAWRADLMGDVYEALGIEGQTEPTEEETLTVEQRYKNVVTTLSKLLNLPQLEAGIAEELDVADPKIKLEGLTAQLELLAAKLHELLSSETGLTDEVKLKASEALHKLVRSYVVVTEQPTLEDGSGAGDEYEEFAKAETTQTVDAIDIKPVTPQEQRSLNREAAAQSLIDNVINISRRYGNDLSNPLVRMRRIMETRHPGITVRVDREGSIVMGIANISGEGLSQQFAVIRRGDIHLFEPLHQLSLDAYNVLRTPDFTIAPVKDEDLDDLATIQASTDTAVEQLAA